MAGCLVLDLLVFLQFIAAICPSTNLLDLNPTIMFVGGQSHLGLLGECQGVRRAVYVLNLPEILEGRASPGGLVHL